MTAVSGSSKKYMAAAVDASAEPVKIPRSQLERWGQIVDNLRKENTELRKQVRESSELRERVAKLTEDNEKLERQVTLAENLRITAESKLTRRVEELRATQVKIEALQMDISKLTLQLQKARAKPKNDEKRSGHKAPTARIEVTIASFVPVSTEVTSPLPTIEERKSVRPKTPPPDKAPSIPVSRESRVSAASAAKLVPIAKPAQADNKEKFPVKGHHRQVASAVLDNIIQMDRPSSSGNRRNRANIPILLR